jgi:hypothetical protein
MSNKSLSAPPRYVLTAFFIPLLLVSIALWGCSARPKALPDDIFLDEAFVTLFPLVSSTLIPGPEPYVGSSLADLESTRKKAAGKSALKPVIASPLIAVGSKSAQGRIISPFLPASIASASGIATIVYDYEAAYKALGVKAGKTAAGRAGKNKGTTLCAVVFQPNSLRGAEALDAFREGYEHSAKPDSLAVEILETASASVDPAGAADAAIRKALSLKPAAMFLALDDSARTILAATDMKKIMRFGDISSWQAGQAAPDVFEYWIEGDERAAAKSALALQRSLASGETIPPVSKLSLVKRARFPRIF